MSTWFTDSYTGADESGLASSQSIYEVDALTAELELRLHAQASCARELPAWAGEEARGARAPALATTAVPRARSSFHAVPLCSLFAEEEAAEAAAQQSARRQLADDPAELVATLAKLGDWTPLEPSPADSARALGLLVQAATRILRLQRGVIHLLAGAPGRSAGGAHPPGARVAGTELVRAAATYDLTSAGVSEAGVRAVARRVVTDGRALTLNSGGGLVLALPLVSADGARFGCLQLFSPPSRRQLTASDVEAARLIAHAVTLCAREMGTAAAADASKRKCAGSSAATGTQLKKGGLNAPRSPRRVVSSLGALDLLREQHAQALEEERLQHATQLADLVWTSSAAQPAPAAAAAGSAPPQPVEAGATAKAAGAAAEMSSLRVQLRKALEVADARAEEVLQLTVLYDARQAELQKCQAELGAQRWQALTASEEADPPPTAPPPAPPPGEPPSAAPLAAASVAANPVAMPAPPHGEPSAAPLAAASIAAAPAAAMPAAVALAASPKGEDALDELLAGDGGVQDDSGVYDDLRTPPTCNLTIPAVSPSAPNRASLTPAS
ncbi:hypothetical protein T492DRAFT_884430 [Pavlovales sp. CCMP2436]|nr:hypothetical protein T492DRAFT_884430 [Pavlovales sp. CCMP2436]